MTMPTPAGVEDRLAVSDTLLRYCSSVDVKDFDTVRGLFADDATASYGGSDWIQGADTIVAWLRAMTAEQAYQHHLLSVYHVDLDATGDEATALSYLVSHQVGAADPDTVLQLVSRYYDTLRRVDGTWRITKKEYVIGWAEVRNAPQSLLLAEPPSIHLPGMSEQLVG
jgi:ketosteroid isomerase-like protein